MLSKSEKNQNGDEGKRNRKYNDLKVVFSREKSPIKIKLPKGSSKI